MSVVTNVVLTHSLHEKYRGDPPVYDLHAQIEQYFHTGGREGDRDSRRGLVSADAPCLPRGWYGGTKMLETVVLIAAFNFLDTGAFVEHLEKLPWQFREGVVLLVKEEQYDAPHVYRFRGDRLEQT